MSESFVAAGSGFAKPEKASIEIVADRSGKARYPAHDPEYASRYSAYGHGIDVRATYAHLPLQPFWTWLTGKYPVSREPRKPVETLLAPWQLLLQLAWSWGVIAASLAAGYAAYHSQTMPLAAKVLVTAVVWLLVTNRTRGLLHTFHYTNHGASIRNKPLAQFLGRWFMSIPILHLSWDNYHAIHAQAHHAATSLCTDDDPDEVFMRDHGFYPGMPEREFWFKLVAAPFMPRAVWGHIRFRLMQNFVLPSPSERLARTAFWVVLLAGVTWAGLWAEFTLFYLVPLLLVTQISSWLQHTTEHLWFAEKPHDVSPHVYYASLTWGRFFGRPYPLAASGVRGLASKARWWALVLVVDLPVKLFSFMQDLPSHDFHHRSPKVNFWSISRERAAHEGRPSKFGPMAETWSLMESWLVIRDHVCHGKSDPFGLWEWDRSRKRRQEAANDAGAPAAAIAPGCPAPIAELARGGM